VRGKSVAITMGTTLTLLMVLLATVPALARSGGDADRDGDKGVVKKSCSARVCKGKDDDDILHGTTGNEILKGNEGNDLLYAGSNLPETVLAGSGNDRVYVENTAPDRINCGPGNDTVNGAIKGVDITTHCEHVNYVP
jgi:Ca2+-binding RTX toxin-like protein